MASSTGLLSPTPSSTSPTLPPSIPSSYKITPLPLPRSHPLISPSSKLTSLIHFLDTRVKHITARYMKRVDAEPNYDHSTSIKGYTSFHEAMADIDSVMNIAWMSGTTGVQCAYLLSIAGMVAEFLETFAYSPDSLGLVAKLDEAFWMLLKRTGGTGRDGRQISVTDRVRIRSVAEETRVIIGRLAAEKDIRDEQGGIRREDDDSEDDLDLGPSYSAKAGDMDEDDSEAEEHVLSAGGVYGRTLAVLGDTLGDLPSPEIVAAPVMTYEGVEVIDL